MFLEKNLNAKLILYFEDLNVPKDDQKYLWKLVEWPLALNLRPFEEIVVEKKVEKIVEFKCRIL